MLKCFCVDLAKRWRFEGLFMISHFNMCLILYRNMHNQNENRQGGEIVRKKGKYQIHDMQRMDGKPI